MFTRQWLRAVLRAGGVVLVVPIGLVLAAVLAAAVGGSSLDGLGQVLDGPQVPRGQAVAADTDGDRAGELGLPTAPRERPAPRGASAVAPRSSGDGGRAPSVTSRRPRPPTAAKPARRPTPGSRPARTPVAGGPAAPSAPTAPAPVAPGAAAPPDVIRGPGTALDDTVRPLAPPVADAVGSIVDLLAPPR